MVLEPCCYRINQHSCSVTTPVIGWLLRKIPDSITGSPLRNVYYRNEQNKRNKNTISPDIYCPDGRFFFSRVLVKEND